MSVSFYPAIEENVAHFITCICEETNFNTIYPTRTAAYEAKKNPLLKTNCEDIYCDYLYVTPAIYEPEVQMSNSNANDLLEVLGLAIGEDFSDYCAGSITAEDFLGRILVAKAVAPVSAERLPEQDGIMIYAGRDEGYVQEKLEQLQEVAEWAQKNQREIIWS